MVDKAASLKPARVALFGYALALDETAKVSMNRFSPTRGALRTIPRRRSLDCPWLRPYWFRSLCETSDDIAVAQARGGCIGISKAYDGQQPRDARFEPGHRRRAGGHIQNASPLKALERR